MRQLFYHLKWFSKLFVLELYYESQTLFWNFMISLSNFNSTCDIIQTFFPCQVKGNSFNPTKQAASNPIINRKNILKEKDSKPTHQPKNLSKLSPWLLAFESITQL